MGTITMKSAKDIADKWAEVTPGRESYYELGVKNPLQDWEKNTLAAAEAFKSAVTASDIKKRFLGGVKHAGTAKWSRKAESLGVKHFGEGVRAAVGDFLDGFEPFRDALDGLTLPARLPRGDPGNRKRSDLVGETLFKKRLALIGAGA